MRRSQKQTAMIIAIVIALTMIVPIQAAAAEVGGEEISSSGACVIDFETGIMLYGYEEDTPRVPASMTKLIAVFVVYDAISAGEISMNSVVKISRGVSDLSHNLEYSNVPLQEGMSATVKELLDVVIIWSACAATVALGEAICGSEAAFVTRMNDKLASLSIDARVYDCYGVSAKNRISPSGMARLARFLILDHPEILNTTSKQSVTFRGSEYKNTNQLLGDYSGMDGIKTGYTIAAGFCFTGTAQRDGRRIIAVTMGSTYEERFPDTRILLDYGFSVAGSIIPEKNRTGTASPSGANLKLNGYDMPLSAYLIGGNHYFRLRDIALLLDGTEYQFDIAWHQEKSLVSIVTGMGYSVDGGSLSDLGWEDRICIRSPSRIIIDDIECDLDVYLIDGSNYFMLRDLSRLIGFSVDWVQSTRTVIIETSS